jgi:membrane protein
VSEGGIGALPNRVRDWADALQRRHTVFGFPYAVIKKYGDDEGGRHAALLTYYGFLSLFPLLLLVVVLVTAVLRNDPALRDQVVSAVVPDQFRSTVESALAALPTSGIPLLIAVVGLLFSGLGIVFSAYQTLSHVAGVPHRRRPEFVPRYLRIVATLLALVLGFIAVGGTTVLLGALPDLGGASLLAGFALNAGLLFLLLWVAVLLLLPGRGQLHRVWPAALVGGITIAGVLAFGALVLPRLVARSGALYGSFATIVGLFALIYLVSQVLVYAAEIAVVRRRRLWPRALDTTKPTVADTRVLTSLAREQERIPVQRVSARFDANVD